LLPAAVCFEQGVGGDDEFAHDGGDGDLGWFSGGDELLVLCFEVWVEARSDECWHVECLPHVGATTSDEALAFPLSGLSRDGGKTGERCGLFVLKAAQFGHGGDELVGGQRSDTGDAGQDLVPAREYGIGRDQAGDLGIERVDMALDLFEALFALAFQDRDGEVLFAVLERGAITHEAITGIDKLGKLGLLGIFGPA
jgi:hypothetical protein